MRVLHAVAEDYAELTACRRLESHTGQHTVEAGAIATIDPVKTRCKRITL